MSDHNVCPGCGGEADNGHDRCAPPNAYLCSGCSVSRHGMRGALHDYRPDKAKRAELVRQSMIRILPHFLQVANTEDSVQGAMTAAIRAADAFLKWEAEQ